MGASLTDHTPTPIFAEPQLVGEHNANLSASTLRVLQGGSWKKQDTIILLPAAKMVPTKAALSWMNLFTPPNQRAPKIPQYAIIGMIGMEVGEAYSKSIEAVLAHPDLSTYRFLLTIEHDNIPPQDGLTKLLTQMESHPELAVISGLYWTKGAGGVPQIWGDARDPFPNSRPQPPDPNGGLVECQGTGMGFALWRLEMFKDQRLRRPWFKTVSSVTEGVGTQDLYFWGDARKNGYRCAVDCSVLVGHYDVTEDKVW
jgi:hypothetical protein